MYVNRGNGVGVCVVLWSIGVASRGLVEVFRRRRQNSISHAKRQNGGRSSHDLGSGGPLLIENALPVRLLEYLWVSPKFAERCRRDLPVLMSDIEEGGVIRHTRRRNISMYNVYIGIWIILRHIIWCSYIRNKGLIWLCLNNVVTLLITFAENVGKCFQWWVHDTLMQMIHEWYMKV
jgi:hypothetical protein